MIISSIFASESHKFSVQAAEYEQLAKSTRWQKKELLEQEGVYSQHLATFTSAICFSILSALTRLVQLFHDLFHVSHSSNQSQRVEMTLI